MRDTIICKICVARYGFKLSDEDRIFNSEDELAAHLEDVHGSVVMREGETEEDAVKRCAEKGICADKKTCKCMDCQRERDEIRDDDDVFVKELKLGRQLLW